MNEMVVGKVVGSERLGVAPCAGFGGLFFSGEPADVERAKRICAGCNHRRACLEGALARHESCGVWGGELVRDGRVLLQTPRRGRPRSVA